MPRLQPYIVASVAYLVLGPSVITIWSLPLAGALPESVPVFAPWVQGTAIAFGYVVLLLWLRTRLRRSNARPPYVLFSIVYWTLAPGVAAVPAMVVGHCDPEGTAQQQSTCMAQTWTAFGISLALALALYLVLLQMMRRKAKQRASSTSP